MMAPAVWGQPVGAPPFSLPAGFAPTTLSIEQLRQYCEEGYCIVEDAIPAHLLDSLRCATSRIIARSRQAEWPNARMCTAQGGEAIPGGPDPTDIWGASNLLQFGFEHGEPAFAQYIDTVIDAVGDILCIHAVERATSLQLGLVNLLCEPRTAAHELPWHRDSFVGHEPAEPELHCNPSAEFEAQKLLSRCFGGDSSTQWNAALYPDSCLRIVPGSHRRLRTAHEVGITRSLFDPPPLRRGCCELPGEVSVELQVGQAVYFQSYLLHRGVYSTTSRRASIHASMSLAQPPAERKAELSPDDHMATPGFVEYLPTERLRQLARNRYVDGILGYNCFRGGSGRSARL
jgi:hypothetical protein